MSHPGGVRTFRKTLFCDFRMPRKKNKPTQKGNEVAEQSKPIETQKQNKPIEEKEEKKDEQKIDESESETDASAVKAVLAVANQSALVKADKKKMDVATIFGTDNKTAAEGKFFLCLSTT